MRPQSLYNRMVVGWWAEQFVLLTTLALQNCTLCNVSDTSPSIDWDIPESEQSLKEVSTCCFQTPSLHP